MSFFYIFVFYKNKFFDSIIYYLRLFWLLSRKFFRRLYNRISKGFSSLEKHKEEDTSSRFHTIFSPYLNTYVRWIRWINSSIFNFAIFFFGSSTLLAIIRYFQIWFVGAWDLLPFYYCTITFSYFISFCAVYGKYQSSVSSRVLHNRLQWSRYTEKVIREKGLSRSQFFAHPFWSLPIFFPINYLEYLNDIIYNSKNLTLTKIGFILTVVAMFYTMNLLYYNWKFYKYIIKPPIPAQYRLEPSELYVKMLNYPIIDKIFFRKYASKTRWQRAQLLFEKNKKSIISGGALLFTSLTLFNTVTGMDSRQADWRDTTSIGKRIYNVADTGFWCADRKAVTRAKVLDRWGVDLEDLSYDGTRKLDPLKVNQVYEAEHIARFSNSRFAAQRKVVVLEAELSETRTELSETRTELSETRTELSETRTELSETRERLDRLERQLDLSKEFSLK